MKRMCDASLDRPAGGYERLSGDEATKDSRATIVKTESAEEIRIERLEIEPLEKAIEMRHWGALARDARGLACRVSFISVLFHYESL